MSKKNFSRLKGTQGQRRGKRAKRLHGFLNRMRTNGGRAVLKNRRLKKRSRLTVT